MKKPEVDIEAMVREHHAWLHGVEETVKHITWLHGVEETVKHIKRSPDCCGCASFPYALCPACYRWNFESHQPPDKERE